VLRLFIREALITLASLLMVSAVAFALLDAVGDRDWQGTAIYAHLFGFTRDHAIGADLPLFWNRRVLDADRRTAVDLPQLDQPRLRAAARARLDRRGSAALPTILSRLDQLTPTARREALSLIASWSESLTGSERAPDPLAGEPEANARAWWARFQASRGLDFRLSYATRQAQRVGARDRTNAYGRLIQLGTFALPGIQNVLAATSGREQEARLTGLLAALTRLPVRADPGAAPGEVQRVTAAWQAFWFAERLEFETLTEERRATARFFETRYGRWVERAMRGRWGFSRLTRRPVAIELRWRLPVSTLSSGLGGLVGTAIAIAFGGGPMLRRRRLRPKLLDLVAALVPGLGAFVTGWLLLLRACSPTPTLRGDLALVLGHGQWARAIVCAAAIAAGVSWFLQRPKAASATQLVRLEAESWVAERLRPGVREVLRHGARIGVASLLAPLGFAGPIVLLASLVVELPLGLDGMGALTARALFAVDAPWLMAAVLTTVPLLLGRRWARGLLVQVLDLPASPPVRLTAPPLDSPT
jgi:ABC-type dipeptide/oligopeptide/nickel transport system permease component